MDDSHDYIVVGINVLSFTKHVAAHKTFLKISFKYINCFSPCDKAARKVVICWVSAEPNNQRGPHTHVLTRASTQYLSSYGNWEIN